MNVLLLSPHTDDIELGAGGTLIKLLEDKNNSFCWVVFAMCEDAVPEGLPPDTLKKEFTSVADRLGVEKLQLYNIPNTDFVHHRQEILSALDKTKKEFEPHLVIMPALSDPHQDHRTIAEEVQRVFKRDVSIIGYEIRRRKSGFNPQLFVRLTEKQIEEKWRILSLYKSQFILKRNYFTKEFIFSWARMRGAQCDSPYAEAFEAVRWKIPQSSLEVLRHL